MKHSPASEFDNAEPIPSAKTRPKNYLPPTVRWDFETAIQADREMNFAAIKAAHVLLDLYNHHDGCAWPSAETIAERIGVTRSTASEAVNKLAKRGWFKIVAVHIGNRQGSNRYFPCIEKAGLSVGLSRHSGDFSVGLGNRQRRLQPTFSVGSDRLSASATADTSSVSEPIKENPIRESKNPSDSAAAGQQHEGPAFATLMNDSPDGARQSVERIALPEGCPFDPDGIARRSDLTAEDIAAAEASFRAKTAGERRIPAEWKRTAKARLGRQNPEAIQAGIQGTLMSEQFMVDDDMLKQAKAFGLTEIEIAEETKAFVDEKRSIIGFKAYSRDWHAEWRTWMRHEAKRKKRSKGFQKPTNSAGSNHAI